MSIGTNLEVGIFLLSRGGVPAVTDAMALTRVYRDLKAGKLKVDDVLTDANLTAAGHLLEILATTLQDPTQKANIMSMVHGL